ncbi:MAG: hypothetical protein B1H12_07435 [Desulfobacteraceae bacterium 4484_190.2]|nr:MAG: hypothetical protein B1H12_07435 [Desulfobacteraceae bacterium 4484_190.2]
MNNVTIVGAGTMGHSLAQVFAQGGYQVFLNDISQDILIRAKSLIEANLETLAEVGLFDSKDHSAVVEERIIYTTDLADAVASSELVIEAIVESPDTKKELFFELDRLSPPEAILASNTSYLNIYEFVETRRPGKVIITHWFAPPHIVPLVEIVPGPHTTPETVETDNGYATPEDIDRATKASFGLRMPILGLVKRVDFAGLDLTQHILSNKSYAPPTVKGRSDVIDSMVSKGRLGVKTGKGFYDYGDSPIEDILRERDLKLLKLKEFLSDMGEMD